MKTLCHSLLLLLILLTTKAQTNLQAVIASPTRTRYPLIPYPQSAIAGTGYFTITPATVIVAPLNGVFKNEADILSALFINSFGRSLKQGAAIKNHSIRLQYDAAIQATEGYHLTITAQQVILSAGSAAGMFMGIQTLRQLLPAIIEKTSGHIQTGLTIPVVDIHDAPAYAWRGMHLDVSRHFFSVSYLKKLIGLMALYKFNTLHLHLTDDQGWRIEIKKYPLLTAQSAWRTFNGQDSACIKKAADNPDFAIDASHIMQQNGKTVYGGFYTQQEMKDIVAYAAARHIDIIPEIDMPGHMMAAIDAYNYLSCDGKSAFGKLFSIPVCPCLPTTFQFAKDIFTEIMDIFPGKYIHIGGDEVDRSFWAKSSECKALMAKEGFTGTAQLQSYFIREMEKFFNANGRQLIGWDEILEGGISKTAVIMYWRTWVPKAPEEAVKNGNTVIMTPGSPMYFSTPADKNALPAVYHYNPVPAGITGADVKNIIGAQACLWAEQVPSEKRADYLLMPRMTALAEMLWTHHDDYPFYLQRLQVHYNRLDLLQVNYRLPDLPVLENYAFTDRDTLTLAKPGDDVVIRYTVDSTLPNAHSTILSKPLVISHSQLIRLALFKTDGARRDVYDLHYQKQSYAEAEHTVPAGDGLTCTWYKRFFKSTTLIPGDAQDGGTKVPGIVVPKEAEAPSFALRYRGYMEVPADDIYTFYLTSDDGSTLTIAGREVINNDGLHPATEKNGQVALRKGLHRIALDFIEGGGGYALKLQYSRNGSEPQDIPAAWFRN